MKVFNIDVHMCLMDDAGVDRSRPKAFQLGNPSCYRPLQSNHIRLVRLMPSSTPTAIHCTVHHHDLAAAAGKYVGLSYCWGNDAALAPIKLDGQDFLVTQNLHLALTTILLYHHHEEVLYWIDAICINQSNTVERNEQVQRMGSIYSNTLGVYAWLGPEDPETALAFNTIISSTEGCALDEGANCSLHWKDKPGYEPLILDDRSAAAVRAIAEREYFTRAWTFQEFVRGPKVTLICGPHLCDWTLLHHMRYVAQDEAGNAVNVDTEHNLMLRSRLTLQSVGLRTVEHRRHIEAAMISNPETAAGLLLTYSQAGCSDDRDRIFAMVGHPFVQALEDPCITVDYSLTDAEVLVCALQWYDRIWAIELAAPDRSGVPLQVKEERLIETIWHFLVHYTFRQSRGGDDVDFILPRSWIEKQGSWDCSKLPQELSLRCGLPIDCSGPVLTYLVGLGDGYTPHYLRKREDQLDWDDQYSMSEQFRREHPTRQILYSKIYV